MDESIKKQLDEIDQKSSKIRKKLEFEVQPLACAVRKIISKLGKKKRFTKWRKEFHSGDLRMKSSYVWSHDIFVYYKKELVFKFATTLCFADIENSKYKLLDVYKSGEWEELVVQEYRKMSVGAFEEIE